LGSWIISISHFKIGNFQLLICKNPENQICYIADANLFGGQIKLFLTIRNRKVSTLIGNIVEKSKQRDMPRQ